MRLTDSEIERLREKATEAASGKEDFKVDPLILVGLLDEVRALRDARRDIGLAMEDVHAALARVR